MPNLYNQTVLAGDNVQDNHVDNDIISSDGRENRPNIYRRNERVVRAENRTAAAQSGTHLYVIRSDSGFLKIGRSNAPHKRMSALQGASAVKLKLVKILRGRGNEERRVHLEILKWRRNGEWFDDTMECRQRLCAVLGVEIRFRREDEASDERSVGTPSGMEMSVYRLVAEVKQRAEREMASWIAAGLMAYRKGRPVIDNPHTKMAPRNAWDKGWRSGCAQDAE